ncbi:hypothetical protein EX30DRAFT_71568 [Ascodesmis nigricans]|uniref:Uncharacterized protein n=1 Tax=Ascodesmis nigricans TaxID=341454 RepID=A0A4S2MTR4_9PEZI|nr:hypothetical protein EX30DRAFT_71568 [Ascodesmis nigricans]
MGLHAWVGWLAEKAVVEERRKGWIRASRPGGWALGITKRGNLLGGILDRWIMVCLVRCVESLLSTVGSGLGDGFRGILHCLVLDLGFAFEVLVFLVLFFIEFGFIWRSNYRMSALLFVI